MFEKRDLRGPAFFARFRGSDPRGTRDAIYTNIIIIIANYNARDKSKIRSSIARVNNIIPFIICITTGIFVVYRTHEKSRSRRMCVQYASKYNNIIQ